MMENNQTNPFADRPQTTPGRIENLRTDEIFVFGSNTRGIHGGGAAAVALHRFGAIWGQAEGIQGQSYAIPTTGATLSEIAASVDRFLTFASQHAEMFFYVTRIGCGNAGFRETEIAPLFRNALTMQNVCLPRAFRRLLEPKPAGEGKTQIYNVIILDRSGSMSSIREAAVNGVNETLAAMQKAAHDYADTQEHYISLVAFCSCKMQKIYDKTPVEDARPLALQDYEPCCCTPLLDAMGESLTDMERHVNHIDDAAVAVTVITDGLENASHKYSGADIKALVERLKEKGWSFTYMGANQDSMEVALTLSIRNSRNFDYSSEGIREGLERERSSRAGYYARMDHYRRHAPRNESREDRQRRYREMGDEAFDETEEK